MSGTRPLRPYSPLWFRSLETLSQRLTLKRRPSGSSRSRYAVIVALRESMVDIGRQELGRYRRKLGPLSEQQERALEQLLHGVVQKMLHRPIRYLRGSVESEEMKDVADLYRRIFALEFGEKRAVEARDDEDSGAGPQRVLRGGKDD